MQMLLSNIDDHLAMVLPLLNDLYERDTPEWTPIQAVACCRSGKWLLFTSDEPGFAMVSVREAEGGIRKFFIEVACHPASGRTVDDYQEFWQYLAKEMGCSEISMSSRRRGWEKKGWLPGWIQYSRPVQEV